MTVTKPPAWQTEHDTTFSNLLYYPVFTVLNIMLVGISSHGRLCSAAARGCKAT